LLGAEQLIPVKLAGKKCKNADLKNGEENEQRDHPTTRIRGWNEIKQHIFLFRLVFCRLDISPGGHNRWREHHTNKCESNQKVVHNPYFLRGPPKAIGLHQNDRESALKLEYH
jgi:hypothetical protein